MRKSKNVTVHKWEQLFAQNDSVPMSHVRQQICFPNSKINPTLISEFNFTNSPFLWWALVIVSRTEKWKAFQVSTRPVQRTLCKALGKTFTRSLKSFFYIKEWNIVLVYLSSYKCLFLVVFCGSFTTFSNACYTAIIFAFPKWPKITNNQNVTAHKSEQLFSGKYSLLLTIIHGLCFPE